MPGLFGWGNNQDGRKQESDGLDEPLLKEDAAPLLPNGKKIDPDVKDEYDAYMERLQSSSQDSSSRLPSIGEGVQDESLNTNGKKFHVLFEHSFGTPNGEPITLPVGATVKKSGIESGYQYTVKLGDKPEEQHMIKPVDNGVMGLYFTDSAHMHKWTRKRYFKLESMKNIYEAPSDGQSKHNYFLWAKEYLINMKEKEVEKLPEKFKNSLSELRKNEASLDSEWRRFLQDVMEFSDKAAVDSDLKKDKKAEKAKKAKKVKKIVTGLESTLVKKQHGRVKGLAKKIRSYVEAKARQAFKGKKRSTLNESVISEYISTEILRAKGFVTHEMSIVTQQAPDSNKKVFALDVKFLGTPETFKTLEGSILDGHLVPGKTAPKGLAASEIAFRMLDDYDAFGSSGANKGVVGDRLQMIDTGNSFSGKGKKLQENFTVSGKEPLKNFSLYSDLPHSQRMAGVILEAKMRGKELPDWLNQLPETNPLNLSQKDVDFWLDIKAQAGNIKPGQDVKCFNTILAFLLHEFQDDKSMGKIYNQVLEQRDAYLQRSNDLLITFEKKLALNPIELDFLQRAEIACSDSVKHFPMEWKKNGDGSITLTFASKNRVKNTEALGKLMLGLKDFTNFTSNNNSIMIPAEHIGKALEKLKENQTVKAVAAPEEAAPSGNRPAVTYSFDATKAAEAAEAAKQHHSGSEPVVPKPASKRRNGMS